MKKRNLDNRSLDAIGRRLVENGSLRSNEIEIEKMISNPDLFGLVSARIATNGKTPSPSLNTALPFIRRNAIAFAGAAVILIAIMIGAAALLRLEKTQFAARNIQIPESMLETARPESPLHPLVNKLSAGRATYRENQIEKIAAKTAVKSADRKTGTQIERESVGEFYYLSTPNDLDETAGGGRIIRVNVPKSSLFALGVNVPLENGPEVVKADLLIGSDGMTRAIRVVN